MNEQDIEKEMLEVVQRLSEQIGVFNERLKNVSLEYLDTRNRLAAVSNQLEAFRRQIASERAEQRSIQAKTREFLDTADTLLRRYL